MATLFISDVHLSAENPRATSDLLALLEGPARRADRLYVLGDLFDAWLGDDDARPPHPQVTAAFAALVASGVPVAVVHGNHDFLLGDAFLEASGCELLADPSVIDLDGERAIVCHGDHLCTDDVEYQQWRAYSRAEDNQRAFLSLPIAARAEQARELGQRSRVATRGKSDAIMDVNDDAVAAMLSAHDASILVHGHTHRPALHEFDLAGSPARRYVLGEWYETSHVLCWSDGQGTVFTVSDLSDHLAAG